jgi:ABC-type dipeptide/oligopeptide/nickel transport system permease subunit
MEEAKQHPAGIGAEAQAELKASEGLAALTGSRSTKRPSAWSVIRKQRLAFIGFLIIAFFALMAIFGPTIAPYSPTQQFSGQMLKAPMTTFTDTRTGETHRFILGSDEFGRDILSRLLYGARVSFQVGFVVVGLAGTVGTLLGLAAGYYRGWIDSVIVMAADVIFAFPAILLAIAFITMVGNNLRNTMIAIAIVFTPAFVRIVRGAVLSVRELAYVEAAVSVGSKSRWIIAKHVFPNITAPLIVHASLIFAGAVLSEAGLSFLGLGNKPPSPSWGSMVSSSYGYLQRAPWAAIVPGTAIAVIVLGFNLLGDGLRDALDPRLRSANSTSGKH